MGQEMCELKGCITRTEEYTHANPEAVVLLNPLGGRNAHSIIPLTHAQHREM